MKTEKEMRSGSKWRRSLMALAIFSAPVVSVAGFSGSAGAATVQAATVSQITFDCTSVGNGFLKVVLTGGSNSDKYSVYVRPGTSNAATGWPNTKQYLAVDNTTWSNSAFLNIDSYVSVLGTGSVPDTIATITSGSFDVKVVEGNKKADDTAVGTPTTVSVACTALTFPSGVVNSFISFVCTSATSANYTVTMPQREPEGAKGPKYDLAITGTSTASYGNLDQGETVTPIVLGNGTYTFTFTQQGGGSTPPVFTYSVTVNCTPSSTTVPGGSSGGSSSGYFIPSLKFLLPTTTTAAPALPSTGSDSNNLLVIAPVMVLLGAGLVMARRRLATV